MDLPALQRHVATLFGREDPAPGRNWESAGDLEIRAEGGRWTVCDTERGEVIECHIDTASEAEACACFLDLVNGRSSWLAGFTDAGEAEQMAEALQTAGIWHWRNDLPEMGIAERYRIFVRGEDLPRARSVMDGRR